MATIYGVTIILLLLSSFKNYQKTKQALKIAFSKFKKVLHPFLMMLICTSLALAVIPEAWIEQTLMGSKLSAVVIGSLLGSIVMMPGFVAFPLASILKESGVSYGVIAAFTTTLMMVGVLTYPVEKAYLGFKMTLFRNGISYFIALITALVIALAFGEVGL